jgi:POT family proton-dependent oligopeptide transporter
MADAPRKSPLREIVQPFIDVAHAPRALWGVNLPYLIEGFVYFGTVGYLAMYFNEYIGLDDIWAGRMVGVLTAGITIAMFFLGGVADRRGVRMALLGAFVLMLAGRIGLSVVPGLHLGSARVQSAANGAALGGILLIVCGYGLYQPAAYAAVRQFTSKKTAAMGYAMLYALMNLGGWLPTFLTPLRQRYGIVGTFWMFSGFTVISLLLTTFLLTRATVTCAIAAARSDRERDRPMGAAQPSAAPTEPLPSNATFRAKVLHWLANHPLADAKFAFFIFALIPVQTLFAHNWLTLPMYVERGYRESWPWISINFEKAVNFNPLLIFILVPIVTAMTQKRKVYNMMIAGTFVMAAPTFLLAIGPTPWTLVGFLVLLTVGEAMWQPRFLQYAAEIAPPGRTGAYMGVAQFPWFLTKMIVPLYSGWFLQRYCPAAGPQDTRTMWLIYGLIAITSTVLLVAARNWLGRDFKTKSD